MPKENKVTRSQKRIRLNIVMKMLLDGLSNRQIHEIANRPVEEKGLGWFVTPRQINNYVSTCFQMMKREFERNEDELIAGHKSRRMEIYRLAKAEGKYQSALNALDQVAYFEGLKKKELDLNIPSVDKLLEAMMLEASKEEDEESDEI